MSFAPKKFILLEDRVIRDTVHGKAGEVVYDFLGCDYGLANDDTRVTGIEHITVTKNPTGKWGVGFLGFTIPKKHLRLVQD